MNVSKPSMIMSITKALQQPKCPAQSVVFYIYIYIFFWLWPKGKTRDDDIVENSLSLKVLHSFTFHSSVNLRRDHWRMVTRPLPNISFPSLLSFTTYCTGNDYSRSLLNELGYTTHNNITVNHINSYTFHKKCL